MEVRTPLLLSEKLQRLSERQTRAKKRAELGVEDEEVLGIDPFSAAEERNPNPRSRTRDIENVESLALELALKRVRRHGDPTLLQDGAVGRTQPTQVLRHLLVL
jgi:hypothetical protein